MIVLDTPMQCGDVDVIKERSDCVATSSKQEYPMRYLSAPFALAGLLTVAACASAPTHLTPTVQGGWTTYAESRIHTPIPCGTTPIMLTGNRLDTHLTGECEHVRITGGHNDIVIDIAPGGTIEIAGSNDDVFWTQTRPGPAPQLIDTGVSNTFHRYAS
jgi:hypothetical protein